MFLLLVFLLVVTPVVEIYLLVRVADAIRWGPTILLVVITGVVGAGLARRQGLATWRKVQADLAQGRMPASEIVDGLLILAAGLVLLTPGMITDCIGLCLLVPPIRRFVKRKAADYCRAHVTLIRHDVSVKDDFVDVDVGEVRDPDSRSTLP